jgi:hypothetical protein
VRAQRRAANTYRAVLAGGSNRSVTLILLFAAVFDGSVSLLRRLAHPRRELALMRAARAKRAVRRAHRDGLITSAVATSPGQLSLRLTGTPALLGRVDGLRLDGPDGGRHDLAAVVASSDVALRIAAALPRDVPNGSRWHVSALAGGDPLTIHDLSGTQLRVTLAPAAVIDDARVYVGLTAAVAERGTGERTVLDLGTVTDRDPDDVVHELLARVGTPR